MKKIIKNIIFVFLVLIILTGCSKENTNNVQAKTDEEISFIEDNIFNIANKYAKGEYLKNDIIEWEKILKDEKKINNCLDSILIDLSQMDIENKDIVEFSNRLNNLIIVTSEKKENNVIIELSNLYSLLPGYMEKYSDDNNEIDKRKIKALVLACYSSANSNNWEEAKNKINDIDKKYSEMMNDIGFMQENEYNLNKVYVLIQELKTAIYLENMDLVNLKYINLIEKM